MPGYMANATGNEKYDFKKIGRGKLRGYQLEIYTYRGMQFQNSNNLEQIFASARDIGNFSAGFVAGRFGVKWGSTRLACDALESWQNGKLSSEGMPTQKAQRLGYNLGIKLYEKAKMEKQIKDAINPIPSGRKY